MLARVIAAVLVAASAVVSLAQAPPQQPQVPVFRSGVDLVPVTVTVTDQQGRPVTDLKQSDFRVFEDNKERPVMAFYPQRLEPGPAVEPTMAIARARASGLAPATSRTFVLVLGFGRIQEPTNALDGAMKFVRENLLPQDAVSVIALHRATKFTTDHRAIEEVLRRYKTHHERMVWDITRFFMNTRAPGVCGGPPLPPEMLAGFERDLFDGIVPASSTRGTLDLLLGMDLAKPTGERSWQEQTTFKQVLKDLEHACVNLSDVMATSGYFRVLAAIEALRFVDGEKHVVFMGTGFAPRRTELLTARANDARVTIDFVSTMGMVMTGMYQGKPVGPVRSFAGCAPCRDVAEATGGLYTSLDYMDQALTKVDQRSRASYLLGYAPLVPSLDGSYRRIRVEVNRPKVTVLYRNGYHAAEELPSLDVQDIVQAARVDAAATYNVDAGGIPVSVALRPGGSRQLVTVDVTVGVSGIPMELVDGLRTGRLEVSVYCGDSKEKVVGETRATWNLRANTETYAEWVAKGLTRQVAVPVTAQPKYVKVVVYDRDSDLVGSKSITIKEP